MDVIHKLKAYKPPDWRECMPRLLLIQVSGFEASSKDFVGACVAIDIVGRTATVISPPLRLGEGNNPSVPNYPEMVVPPKHSKESSSSPTVSSSLYTSFGTGVNEQDNKAASCDADGGQAHRKVVPLYQYEVDWKGLYSTNVLPIKGVELVRCRGQSRGWRNSISDVKDAVDAMGQHILSGAERSRRCDSVKLGQVIQPQIPCFQERLKPNENESASNNEPNSTLSPCQSAPGRGFAMEKYGDGEMNCDMELFGGFTSAFTRPFARDVVMRVKMYYWHDFTEIGVFRLAVLSRSTQTQKTQDEGGSKALPRGEAPIPSYPTTTDTAQDNVNQCDRHGDRGLSRERQSTSLGQDIVVRIPLKKVTASPFQAQIQLGHMGKVLVEAISLPWDHPSVTNDTLLNEEGVPGSTAKRAMRICPLFKRLDIHNGGCVAPVLVGDHGEAREARGITGDMEGPISLFNFLVGRRATSRTPYELCAETLKGLRESTTDAIRGIKVTERPDSTAEDKISGVSIIIYDPEDNVQVGVASCLVSSFFPVVKVGEISQATELSRACGVQAEPPKLEEDVDKRKGSCDTGGHSDGEESCTCDLSSALKDRCTTRGQSQPQDADGCVLNTSETFNTENGLLHPGPGCMAGRAGRVLLFPVPRTILSMRLLGLLVLSIRVMGYSFVVHKYGPEIHDTVGIGGCQGGTTETEGSAGAKHLPIHLVLLMDDVHNDYFLHPFTHLNLSSPLHGGGNKLFDFSQSDTVEFSSSCHGFSSSGYHISAPARPVPSARSVVDNGQAKQAAREEECTEVPNAPQLGHRMSDTRDPSLLEVGDVTLDFNREEAEAAKAAGIGRCGPDGGECHISQSEYNDLHSQFVWFVTQLIEGAKAFNQAIDIPTLPNVPPLFVIPTGDLPSSGPLSLVSRSSKIFEMLFATSTWRRHISKITDYEDKYKANTDMYLRKMSRLVSHVAGPVRIYMDQDTPCELKLGNAAVLMTLTGNIVKVNSVWNCRVEPSMKTRGRLFGSKVYVQMGGDSSPHMRPIKIQKFTELVPSRCINITGVIDIDHERPNEWSFHHLVFHHSLKEVPDEQHNGRDNNNTLPSPPHPERASLRAGLPSPEDNQPNKAAAKNEANDKLDGEGMAARLHTLAASYLRHQAGGCTKPSNVLRAWGQHRDRQVSLAHKNELLLDEVKVRTTGKSLAVRGHSLTRMFDTVVDGMRFIGTTDVAIASRTFAPVLSIATFPDN